MDIALSIAIIVFLMGVLLYTFNAVHPPAITAALSFLVLNRAPKELIYLFLAIIAILILTRLITYLVEQRLSLKEFIKEFEGNLKN